LTIIAFNIHLHKFSLINSKIIVQRALEPTYTKATNAIW